MARVARPVPVKEKVARPSLAARYPDWFALGVVSVAGGWEPLVDQLFADLAATLDKDMKAVKQFTHDLGLALPLVEQAVAQYGRYVAQGNEMADSASIVRLYDPRK